MQKFTGGILALLLGLSLNQAAHAGVYLEPYLGYAKGEFEWGDLDEDVKGMGYGMRLGFGSLGFSFGADYATGTWKLKPSGSNDVDFNVQDLGAFVAYEFPIMFRVYASYFFSSKHTMKSVQLSAPPATPTTDDLIMEGKGTKLGIGYTGLPFVSINFEYLTTDYDKAKHAIFTGGSMKPKDATFKAYMLGLSLPFNL